MVHLYNSRSSPETKDDGVRSLKAGSSVEATSKIRPVPRGIGSPEAGAGPRVFRTSASILKVTSALATRLQVATNPHKIRISAPTLTVHPRTVISGRRRI